MSTSQSLPLYQCHKQVRAVKIKEVMKHAHPDPKADDAAFESSPAFQGAHLLPIDERLLPIAVDADWYHKHSPQPGGYYVLYEDGYTSYSPAAAFESGYSPVLAMAQQNSRIGSAGAMVGASASISGQQRISHREELERLLASGASAQIAHAPENAAAIAKGIKTVLDELAPVAPHPVAIAPLPAIDTGPSSHASAVLYPAIDLAMGELQTLPPEFNATVNRAFNLLHDAFWSECPAPASAAPKRPDFPGV